MPTKDPRLQRLKELIERQVVAILGELDIHGDIDDAIVILHLNGTIEAAWPAIMEEGEELNDFVAAMEGDEDMEFCCDCGAMVEGFHMCEGVPR